jgi:hypothetical protein
MITRSMLNAAVKHLSIGILILSPAVLLACDSALSYQHSADQREAINKPTTQRSSNTNDSPHDPVTDGYIQGTTASAWHAFTQDGRYRWADQNDFRFPDWAKQQRSRLDVERAMKTPIQAGHIKGSYESIEVALIVVDTTRPDWNRYGIVIISERRKKPQKPEIKWLFRDRDLSRVQLDWSSGDTLGIAEYGDDGLRRHCFVKWDAKKRRYLCALRQVK